MHFPFMYPKAFNNVGLFSVQIFGAFLVDESPPIKGHVYDGYQIDDQKDQDYQQETRTLHAFWEGFHDPHSEVLHFTLRIGLCQGCDDVIKEHYVGAATGTN